MTRSTLDSLLDRTIIDADGAKIGKVKQIYLDNETGSPTWVAVSTGWFSLDSLVPLAGARPLGEKGDLRVLVRRGQVKSAPHLETDGRLTRDAETKLFSHYGIDPNATGRHAAPDPVIRPDTDRPLTTGRVRAPMTGDRADLPPAGKRTADLLGRDGAGTRTTGDRTEARMTGPGSRDNVPKSSAQSREDDADAELPAGKHRRRTEEPDVLW